jgi:hypothetical protein
VRGCLIGQDDDQELGVGRQGSAGVREIGYRTSLGLRLGAGRSGVTLDPAHELQKRDAAPSIIRI